MIARRRPLKRTPLRRKHFTRIRSENPVAAAKRRARYKAAISTGHWKKLRLFVFHRDRGICQVCGKVIASLGEMHLAHRTYARLGKERPEDVEANHRSCNEREAALRGRRIQRSKTAA